MARIEIANQIGKYIEKYQLLKPLPADQQTADNTAELDQENLEKMPEDEREDLIKAIELVGRLTGQKNTGIPEYDKLTKKDNDGETIVQLTKSTALRMIEDAMKNGVDGDYLEVQLRYAPGWKAQIGVEKENGGVKI